jgi:hypothetical protein
MSGFSIAPKIIPVAMAAPGTSHTGDTNSFAFATITLPVMGPNDQLEIVLDFAKTGTAGTFTPSIKLGNTVIMGGSAISATILSTRAFQIVANKGATNSQEFMVATSAFSVPFTNSTNAIASGAEETNAGATLTITGALASAADTLALARYSVMLWRS